MNIHQVCGALAVVVAVLSWGCGPKEFQPPPEDERVEGAAAQLDANAFDSIAWDDTERMLVEGAAVYAATCRDCHGVMGEGSTEYAATRRLAVPSLVLEDWPYASDLPAVRRLVFSGHSGGMPTHGIAGISLREIDAVSRYLLEQLRPEVLSGR